MTTSIYSKATISKTTILKQLILQICLLLGTAVLGFADCNTLPGGFQIRSFQDGSGTHQYGLFLPKQYSPDQKWPVILSLHGAGEKGTDGQLPISTGLAVALEHSPDLPFVVVFPQCEDVTGRSLTGWMADSPDGRRAMSILDQVEKDFSVDASRRILTGWSMGGYGAWSFAAAYPKHWSSVLILAGGALPNSLNLKELADARTPVWAISGKQDPLISYTQSQQLVDQLNQLGGNGEFTLLSPAGHNICPTVYAAPQVFQWLTAPQSTNPKAIQLQGVKPLPIRTRYARECQLHERLIPAAMSIRMGNAALAELATGMPAAIPQESLQGTLANVRQTVGNPEDPWTVELSDLKFQCHVTRFQIQAISGCRLGMEIDLHPLKLTIGRTRLSSQRHFAEAGEIQIQLGLHEPATLKLEVQPVFQEGRLRLIPLRQNFDFDEGNWYISPPENIQIRSPVYTADQMKTGIVGSLYESRGEMVKQVLGVVPDLLKNIEAQLGFRAAPALARVLSPVPALIPEIEVGPSQVELHSDGISMLCDIQALSYTPGPALPVHPKVELADLENDSGLGLELTLDAITQLTRVSVEQDRAKVNVLDISDDQFAVLANSERMHEVFPDLNAAPARDLRTVLRLLSPLVLKAGNASNTQEIDLLLSADRVCLEVFDPDSKGELIPVGRLIFQMEQPMVLSQPSIGQDGQSRLGIRWQDHCRVTFLHAESLTEGMPAPQVNSATFETLFQEAWLSWAAEHATQSISTEVVQLGTAQVRLQKIESHGDRLEFHLEAVSFQPEPKVAAGK